MQCAKVTMKVSNQAAVTAAEAEAQAEQFNDFMNSGICCKYVISISEVRHFMMLSFCDFRSNYLAAHSQKARKYENIKLHKFNALK